MLVLLVPLVLLGLLVRKVPLAKMVLTDFPVRSVLLARRVRSV